MVSINIGLSDAFIAFFAVVGPPKILLSFADLAEARTARELSRLAVVATLSAAAVGVLLDYSAPAVLALFHISTDAVELAGGLIFLLYAIGLVLGGRPDSEAAAQSTSLVDGLRELVVPFIASPLVTTAVLLYAVDNPGWEWRTSVAGAFIAVLAIDLVCVLALVGLLRRTDRTVVSVLARLLGLLLAALSVEVVLEALAAYGVPVRGY